MSVEIRSPRATARVNGESLPTSRIQVTIAVGGPPSASIRLHKRVDAAQSATSVLSGEIAAKLGASQKQLFASKNGPDSVISMSDGAGNTLEFKGYVSSPTFSLVMGNVGFNYNLQHESAVLGAYRSSIYTNFILIGGKWEVGNPVAKYLEKIGAEVNYPSVSRRIKKLHEMMLDNWSSKMEGLDAYTIDVNQAIHALNERLKHYWFDILEASHDSTAWDSLGELTEADNKVVTGIHNTINAYILAVLQRNTQNFYATIAELCSSFQMLWVPTLGAKAFGKFIRFKDVITDNAESKTIQVKSTSICAGNRNILPVTHAVVMGPYAVNYLEGSPNPNIGSQAVAVWPHTIYEGGQVFSDSGPPWIGPALMKDPDPSKANETKIKLDLSLCQSAHTNLADTIVKINDKKLKILEEWARNNYVFSSLSEATAEIPTLLDLSLQPGTCYRVLNGNGEYLFTGFLSQVTHIMETESQQPQVESVLVFTHVQASGFTFPHKT